jgi:hypothetical protein
LQLVHKKAADKYHGNYRYRNDFLSRTPSAHQLRERMDNMKLKSFCTTKDMVSKLKRPPTECEKILPGYKSDKRLITKIYRELKNPTSPKINEPIKKWVTELNRTFCKVENQCIQK